MYELFSTKERLNMLRKVIYSTTPVRVNSLADELKISKGLVSKYMKMLESAGLVRKGRNGYLPSDSAEMSGIRIMLNMQKLPINILKKYKSIKAAGIYGSAAKGENTEESDMDMWIFIENEDEGELAEISSRLSKKINNLSLLFLNKAKIERLKSEDTVFYHSLIFGSIIIYGRENGDKIF